jgi:hypothetical protein
MVMVECPLSEGFEAGLQDEKLERTALWENLFRSYKFR